MFVEIPGREICRRLLDRSRCFRSADDRFRETVGRSDRYQLLPDGSRVVQVGTEAARMPSRGFTGRATSVSRDRMESEIISTYVIALYNSIFYQTLDYSTVQVQLLLIRILFGVELHN